MKRIIIFLLLTIVTSVVCAQTKMHISEIMNAKKHPAGTVDVNVKSKDLKAYNLRFYHSCSFPVNNDTRELISKLEEAVKADGKKATDKEVATVGNRIYYAEYTLPSGSSVMNRYIFYKNPTLRKGQKTKEVTVIYIEGDASLEEIKKMFKK